MKHPTDPCIEPWRIGGEPGDPNGTYLIPASGAMPQLRVIVGCGAGWDHASVSLPHRIPDYDHLSLVRDLFWAEDETVMHLWVPRVEHISYHAFCIHLWRPQTALEIARIKAEWTAAGEEYPWGTAPPPPIPRPPAWLVGPL